MLVLLFFILSGCNSSNTKITEEQAKAIVIEHHTNQIGKVEIVSVTTKFNKYIIEWENKENCEEGTDTVNKKGEVTMVDASIC